MVCVDLVSPFTINIPSKTYSLLAITMIDIRMIKFKDNSAMFNQDLFNNTWLALSLNPQFTLLDIETSSEFKLEIK
jgi:hypothetical protein